MAEFTRNPSDSSPLNRVLHDTNVEDDSHHITDVIIAGELITPTAMLQGETSVRPSIERGWLASMTRAHSRPDLSPTERLQNVRTIAKEAIRRTVLSETQVQEKLEQLGVLDSISKENSSETTSINYEAIAKMLPLDEQAPPSPENLIQPLVTNMFADTDTATLTGKMVAHVYKNLVLRPDQKSFTAEEVLLNLEKSKESRKTFVTEVEKINQERIQNHRPPFDLAITREKGKDGFHFNGNTTVSQEFLFYFNKSRTNFKSSSESFVRAYITLDPKEQENNYQHFIELATQLYDAGIDFSAKAASIFGVIQRTDNMVFEIAQTDQQKAADILHNYLANKKIGQGKVLAAQQDSQEGLSWAPAPSSQEIKQWQQASGSSQLASFNSLVALKAMPSYLERVAAAHKKNGDTKNEQIFHDESERVRQILSTPVEALAQPNIETEKLPSLSPSREDRVHHTLDYAQDLIPGFIRKYTQEQRQLLTGQGTEPDPFIVPENWNNSMAVMQGFVISLTEGNNRPVFIKNILGPGKEVLLEVDGLNRSVRIHKGSEYMNVDVFQEKAGFFEFQIVEKTRSSAELRAIVEFQPPGMQDPLPVFYETQTPRVTGDGLSETTPLQLDRREQSLLSGTDGLYAFIRSVKESRPIFLLAQGVLMEIHGEKEHFRYIAGTPDRPEISAREFVEVMKKNVLRTVEQFEKYQRYYEGEKKQRGL